MLLFLCWYLLVYILFSTFLIQVQVGGAGAGGLQREGTVLAIGLEVDQVKFEDVLVNLQFMSWGTFPYKEWIKDYLCLSST